MITRRCLTILLVNMLFSVISLDLVAEPNPKVVGRLFRAFRLRRGFRQ